MFGTFLQNLTHSYHKNQQSYSLEFTQKTANTSKEIRDTNRLKLEAIKISFSRKRINKLHYT